MTACPVKRVVVIGGGITGLAAAHRLIERSREGFFPVDVALLEGSARVGGVIRTERRGGFLVEAGPDSFLTDKPEGLNLCERLGLIDELIGTNPACRKSYVVYKGRLVHVPAGFSLLAPARLLPFAFSPLLSLNGKLRALWELFTRKGSGKDEGVASFIRRRFGPELYERLAEPMVRGVASGNPENLSMRALFPQFLEMEAKYGSVIRALRARRAKTKTPPGEVAGPRYGLFASFHEGMQTLTDSLTSALPQSLIRLNTPVLGITRPHPSGRFRVLLRTGPIEADAVLIAAPPHRACEILSGLDAPLAELLRGFSYASWITASMAYHTDNIKRPLDGFGMVIPAGEGIPLTGVTFCHVKFPGRAPRGGALLRAFILLPDGSTNAPDDHEVERIVRDALSPLLSVRGEPLWTAVYRLPRSLPRYELGHLDRVQRIRERAGALGGVYLAGNAYGGHGVTNCVRSAEGAADGLWEELQMKRFAYREKERVRL